ncbi:MAG: DUF4258 domain-containing protein [Steroidobacteraceae bacterium]
MTALKMTAAQARERVRAIAADSGNLRWSQHIRQRMEQRGFDDGDVLRVLRTGDVENAPSAGKEPGEWKIKLTKTMSGGRVAGVLTVLLVGGKLRLVTVEWEDHR